MRTLLRDRNLVLLLGSGMVSQLGDWALLLGLPLFVYSRTHSIPSTGALVAVDLLPRLIVSPIAGVLADRWNRKLTLIGADVFRAAVVLVLLVAAAGGPIWLVYAVALLEASASQLFVAADSAVLPTIVRKENLLRANSLLSVGNSTIRLVGPPAGGLLFALLGVTASAFVDSASFLVSAALLFAIRLPAAARPAPEPGGGAASGNLGPFVGELADGVRCIVTSRVFETLFVVLTAVAVAQGMLETLLVPFVIDVLHYDPTRFGVLVAAQGLGGLLGALALGAVTRYVTSGRVVGGALALAGAFLACFVVARPLALSAASLFLVGLPMVVAAAWVQTYYQEQVSNQLLGRVFGLTETVSSAGIFVGVGAASVFGSRLGIVPLMLAAAAVLLVTGVFAGAALWSTRTSQPELATASREEPAPAT
jgi:predicted MFS family arabinose efflux permease